MTSPDSIPLETARNRLAMLWLAGFGVILILLIAQTMGTAFGDRAGEVWSWITPHLSPTLALIITVWAATAVRTPGEEVLKQEVSRSFFRAAFWISVFYLLLILASIFCSPIVAALRPDETFTIVDAIKMSNLWLALVQGIVVFFIGALFVKKEKASPKQADRP